MSDLRKKTWEAIREYVCEEVEGPEGVERINAAIDAERAEAAQEARESMAGAVAIEGKTLTQAIEECNALRARVEELERHHAVAHEPGCQEPQP